jgi:hypothetical protein
METSPRIRRVALCLLAALTLAGCDHFPRRKEPGPIQTASEVEVAVSEIDVYWLDECKRMPPFKGKNAVGEIIQDTLVAYGRLAQCASMHDQLVRYLRPIVTKARAATKTP